MTGTSAKVTSWTSFKAWNTFLCQENAPLPELMDRKNKGYNGKGKKKMDTNDRIFSTYQPTYHG